MAHTFKTLTRAQKAADSSQRPLAVVKSTLPDGYVHYCLDSYEGAQEYLASPTGKRFSPQMVYMNAAAQAESERLQALLPTEEPEEAQAAPEPFWRTPEGKANLERILDSTAAAIASSGPVLERLVEEGKAEQAAQALPAVVECPACLFQHLEGEECPQCTGNWPRALELNRQRAFTSQGEHPHVMATVAREQGTIKVGPYRDVTTVPCWYIRMECPVCGRRRKLEAQHVQDQLAQGMEYVCTGHRQLWQVIGTYNPPQQAQEAQEWDYSKGPQPAPTAGLLAELSLAEAAGHVPLTDEQYLQMQVNAAQWASQLEEARLQEQMGTPPDKRIPGLELVVAQAQVARDSEGTGLDYRLAIKRVSAWTVHHHEGTIDELVVDLTEWATAQGAGELEIRITL